tara:strand:+ start:1674 stop:1913 length:240 start_codon:yes stop_codon:yes gene_type:complete
MIMIDSKAGQRLAKAGAVLAEAEEAVNQEIKRVSANRDAEFSPQLNKHLTEARWFWRQASEDLTKELMAAGHHLAEDYK